MNLRDDLCKAFCGSLTVNPVPAGFAVGTGHDNGDGDHIGFYVIGPSKSGTYHIQDDGLTIAYIEAAGADLENKARKQMLSELRDQYAVIFDKHSGELKSRDVRADEVASEALRFMAFMLRVQDLVMTSTERAVSTFKEDASLMLRELIGDRAEIKEHYALNDQLKEFPADLAILAPNRVPVALFFGITDLHVMEALLLQSYAEKEKVPCKVVALLERENAITHKARQRASNHLEAVPQFRGAELDACRRIARVALE